METMRLAGIPRVTENRSLVPTARLGTYTRKTAVFGWVDWPTPPVDKNEAVESVGAALRRHLARWLVLLEAIPA
jgi:hypothetical protein